MEDNGEEAMVLAVVVELMTTSTKVAIAKAVTMAATSTAILLGVIILVI